jgi:hypothetical protein
MDFVYPLTKNFSSAPYRHLTGNLIGNLSGLIGAMSATGRQLGADPVADRFQLIGTPLPQSTNRRFHEQSSET